MLKTLVKKQISEIFRQYFYNPKTNKKRSTASTVAYIILFVVLMGGMLGGTFGTLASAICRPMFDAGAGWLYFCIMGLISLALGVFGSVFNTYTGLYLSKDNDLLLSMPIPTSTVIASRVIGVYLMGLLYGGVVSIPAVVVCWVKTEQSFLSILGGILYVLCLSVAVLVLSCALGWCVAKISLKLKNKSFATVFASLLFIGLYYFSYYKAQSVITALVSNASGYAQKIKGFAYPLYLFASMGTGNIAGILCSVAVCTVLVVLTWLLLSASFIKIATSTGKVARVKEKKTTAKQNSVFSAMLKKEFAHFFASPSYMLNCGFGMFVIPIAGVAFLFKANTLQDTLNTAFTDMENFFPVLMCGILCTLATMNDVTVPSISLEGNSLWLLQSLPVNALTVLKAKLAHQLIITCPVLLFGSICIVIGAKTDIGVSLILLILPQVFALLFALIGLIIGLKSPILTWENEIIPIKQNFGVLIAIFSGWAIAIAPVGLYFAVKNYMAPLPYLAVLTVLATALTAVLYRFIVKKGCAIFNNLS